MQNACRSFDEIFSAYSPQQTDRLQALRKLVHETADGISEVQKAEECLKWGQASFVAKPEKTGSTVRIDAKDDGVSVYFMCNTSLVSQFREIYPDVFTYFGNREIHFGADDDVPTEELRHCIGMALTYHLRKKG